MVKDTRNGEGNDDGYSNNPWSGDSKLGVSNLLGIVIVIVLVATIAIGASQIYQLAPTPDDTAPDVTNPNTEDESQPTPPDDTEIDGGESVDTAPDVTNPNTEDESQPTQGEQQFSPGRQQIQPLTPSNNTVQDHVGINNHPPIAIDNTSITTGINQPVTIQLAAGDTDNDNLMAAIVSNPLYGTLSEINQDTGVVTYTPNLAFVGIDEFTFKVNDGKVYSSNVGTVRIRVS